MKNHQLAIVSFLALSACKQGPGKMQPFESLESSASLREAFNRQAGKVRVVMLVAPT